jgi:hypothetical protein
MRRLDRESRSATPRELALPAAAAVGTSGTVQVIWGPFTEPLEVAGLSVAQAFELLRDPFNIAPGAEVNVNGVAAAPEQRLRAGDVLEFVRGAGEKGAAA